MTPQASISAQLLKNLSTLKAAQLQHLAVALGTSCSGTKATIQRSIAASLSQFSVGRSSDLSAPSKFKEKPSRPFSLVSIDMGIRNLAYACLRADVLEGKPGNLSNGQSGGRYGKVQLRAWEKVAIAPSFASPADKSAAIGNLEGSTSAVPSGKRTKSRRSDTSHRESFAPDIYASHAYSFLTRVIAAHRPTHVLIERQRFRSGGSPVVQDWSIRVGVFEGMLWAVLMALVEKGEVDLEVEGIDPAKIGRFWVREGEREGEHRDQNELAVGVMIPKGRELKRWKIDLVGRMLEKSAQADSSRDISAESQKVLVDTLARPMVNAYLTRWKKEAGGRRSQPSLTGAAFTQPVEGLSKLDDLADCLLQGMAWMQWQNNRHRVLMAAEDSIVALLDL